PEQYTLDALVGDVLSVIDAYMLDTLDYLSYSLGARVGWRLASEFPGRVNRAVLGGLPDSDPLLRFRLDEARASIRGGSAVDDKLTATYLSLAATLPGNDPEALVSLVEGM